MDSLVIKVGDLASPNWHFVLVTHNESFGLIISMLSKDLERSPRIL